MTAHAYPTPPRSDERRVLGHPVPRLEDRPLLTGHGHYVVTSPSPSAAHARRALHPRACPHRRDRHRGGARPPGVVAIWTGDDIADLPPIVSAIRRPRAQAYRQPVLAKDRVRYVGEPVAAVFAADPYLAEDAADLVEVKIDALPAVLDARWSARRIRAGPDTEPRSCARASAISTPRSPRAHTIVELKLTIGRHSGVPMETRGAIGRYDAARDVLELYGAAKVPHRNRDTLARMLGRTPARCICTRAIPAAASASAASFIRRISWCCVAAMRFGRR